MAGRAGVARPGGWPTSLACGRKSRPTHKVMASANPQLVSAPRRPDISDIITLGVAAQQPDTSAVVRAALFLAERGNSRGMVLAALAVNGHPASASADRNTHEAAVGWLQGAAANGDVWAVLLLALRDWEDSNRSWHEIYAATKERVTKASALVARQSEELASKAQRDPGIGPGWSLQCEGRECGLAPAPCLGPASASLEPDSLHPSQPAASAAVAPVGFAADHNTLLPTSFLGSYDAVVGSELAWRQLQSVRSMVAEVVGLEGGLELWSLLDVLGAEEARQGASRSFSLV